MERDIPKVDVGYGAAAKKLSWQGPFPEATPCVKCGKDSLLTLAIAEEGPVETGTTIALLGPYVRVVLGCRTVTTLWNQGVSRL